MSFLDVAQVELALIELLQGLGYEYAFGPDLACDGSRPERTSYSDVILYARLRAALTRLNSQIPAEARDEAFRKVICTDSPQMAVIRNALLLQPCPAKSVSVTPKKSQGTSLDVLS